jgi:hypothetical protein
MFALRQRNAVPLERLVGLDAGRCTHFPPPLATLRIRISIEKQQ